MVNLTIDGKKIEVKEGTTVLGAARQAGIDIPTLCDHPQLTPYGGCRLCLVEVEGARTLQPSCTLPANSNMVVHTDTQKIRDARKFVLTMIFSERNHFCPYCQVSGGDCELQNAAYAEGMTHWPIQPNWKPYPVDASHPFIVLEHNRCILCRRCVRACGELIGNFTLGFEERGAESTLVADMGLPLGESTCIGCGTCVQVCPTGALIDRWSAYQGKETEVEVTPSICQGCSIGCNINVLTRDNRLVRIEGDWEGEVNQGVICDVGRFHPMIEDRDRILTPLIRKNGSLKAATWDDALIRVSEIARAADGKKSAVVSTRLSLEALDAFNQVCSQLGIKEIFSSEEGLATSAAMNLRTKTGKPVESKLSDIKQSDCYIVVGEDITKDHQVISFFIKRQLPAGTKLIQICANESGFDNFATHTINIPDDKTAKFVSSFRDVINSSDDKDIEQLAKENNLDSGMLRNVVQDIKSSNQVAIVLGSRYHFADSDSVYASVHDLAVSVNGKFLSTKGNINSLAAAQMGINNPIDFKSTDTVLFALGDENLSQQTMKKFENIPHLVILASYSSPLTASAEVVLPVSNWIEQDGHFMNLSGMVLEAKGALTTEGECVSNLDVIKKLAESLNISIKPQWKDSIKFNSIV